MANKSIDNDNFTHFVAIAQEISKHYSQRQKHNVQQIGIKVPNGTQIKNVYNEQYQYEQIFMILFLI